MKSEKEIKSQVTAVRERVKELSGFWISEGAAMIYALEWALDKRETAPAGELGRAGGESERIAANLTKLVEKAAASPKSRAARVAPNRGETPGAPKKGSVGAAAPSAGAKSRSRSRSGRL